MFSGLDLRNSMFSQHAVDKCALLCLEQDMARITRYVPILNDWSIKGVRLQNEAPHMVFSILAKVTLQHRIKIALQD